MFFTIFVIFETDIFIDILPFVEYNRIKTNRSNAMIKRKTYLDQIIPLIDKPLIKVITGVRRSGKTVLLKQIQEYLLSSGCDKNRIVYISFESKANAYLKNTDTLYRYLLDAGKNAAEKVYIFLDEIQSVPAWEEVVSSLLVDLNCDIYITGSNSKLLSGELASLIAGRYIQIRVYPFTLAEAKEITLQNGNFVSDEALFSDYLRYGGLPLRFSLEEISIEPYLSDTYDAIVVKDIVQRNKLNDANLLNLLLNFLMDNIANPFSARSIVAALAANGIKTTVDTVLAYIGYIKNAMIIHSAQRYDIKGKKLLSSNEKYYAADLGLRNVIKSSDEIDFNKLYENIVYLELLARGYEVKVGKTDNYEIDFVAYKGKERIYVQVCYLLASEDTINREFGNLEKIHDYYPKYVISGDLPDFSRNGIRHFNIIKFLLDK